MSNIEDNNIEDNNIEDIDSLIDNMELSLEKLTISDPEVTEEIATNDIIENVDELNLGLTKEEIKNFYSYLSGKESRPQFAEKFFSDSESRLKESTQITSLMGLSFIPKLLGASQSIINDLTKADNLKFLSREEKIDYLQTFSAIATKFNEVALKNAQAIKDFSSMPLIYRQLLDQLLLVPNEKLYRLKKIPELMDLDDDTWNRIVEIADLK
jgi:hypothetical protein